MHQIIVQQNYFNLIKKNIALSVIKYNNKDNNYVFYIDGQTINKNLLNVYYNITNNTSFDGVERKTNTSFDGVERKRNTSFDGVEHNTNTSLYIIYDIALIFYFFGNDHLPSSFYIGPELTLELYFKTHYKSLKNNYIIELDKNNKITLNYNYLLLWLKEINKTNEINKTKNYIKSLYSYLELNGYKHLHFFGWDNCIISDSEILNYKKFLNKSFGGYTDTMGNEHPNKTGHSKWSSFLLTKIEELNYINN